MINWEVSLHIKIKSPITPISWKMWNTHHSQIQTKEITFKWDHSNLQVLFLLGLINPTNILAGHFANFQQICWKWSGLRAQRTFLQEIHWDGEREMESASQALSTQRKLRGASSELFCLSAPRTTTKVSNSPINLLFKTTGINWLNWAEPNWTGPRWAQGGYSSHVSQMICSLTGCRNTAKTVINDIFCECSDRWLWNVNTSKWRRKIFWQKQQTRFWRLYSKPLENSIYRVVSSIGISSESLLTRGIETILTKDLAKCKMPVT